MGLVKSQWMESQERGWDAPDLYVCADCVDDHFLKSVISSNSQSNTCDYCGRSSTAPIAAPMEDILAPIADSVYYYFNDPTAAGVPWDDGSPVIEPTYTVDVLMSLSLDCDEKLFDDIVEAFHNDAWVPAAGGHWASSHLHDVLISSWDGFVRSVKYDTRFFFDKARLPEFSGPEEYEPRAMLPAIESLVHSLSLVTIVPEGSSFFRVRARLEEAEWEANAATMGAPPSQKARAGRMNPAGISYLYLALDASTAFAEVVNAPPVKGVLAEFRATRNLVVLNLTRLPELPSVFDSARRRIHEGLLFLERFVLEISQPVRKDGREHIEYVPSQVVSEYFALIFTHSEQGNALDGIVYPSAVKPGGQNLVLFPTERKGERKFNAVNYVDATEYDFPNWQVLSKEIGRG